MRRGDYAETRAVIELSAAEGPRPTYLLDITDCQSTCFSVQEVTVDRRRTAERSSNAGLFSNWTPLISRRSKYNILQMPNIVSGCFLFDFGSSANPLSAQTTASLREGVKKKKETIKVSWKRFWHLFSSKKNKTARRPSVQTHQIIFRKVKHVTVDAV